MLSNLKFSELSIRKHGWKLIMQFSENALAKDGCSKGKNLVILTLESSSVSY